MRWARAPREAPSPPDARPVETALTVARISSYDASTARLRDVAKWFATSTIALVAFLAAAFPVAGVVSDAGAVTWPALLWGAGVLASLGSVVALAARVLAPRIVTLRAVATEPQYASLRAEIAAEPATFLGLWATDVAGLQARRERAVADQRNVVSTLADPDLVPVQARAFESRRLVVERDLTILGWVTYRIESAGLYALTWRRFTTLRWGSAVAAVVAAVCLLGLVASVRGVATEQHAGRAVTLTFLDTVEPDPTSLLGASCPDVVSGELVSSDVAPPWTVRVTQDGCDPATLHVTGDQAVVVLREP